MPSVDTIMTMVDLTIVLVVLVTGYLLHRQARRFRRLRTEPGMVIGFLGLGLLTCWSLAALYLAYIGPVLFDAAPDALLNRLIRYDLRWPANALAISLMAVGAVMVARVIVDLDRERRKSEAQLRRAVRLAKVGHWIWDHKLDKSIYASPEIAEIFDVSVEEYMRNASSFETELDWYPDTEREAYFKTVHEATVAGTGYELVTAIRRRSGEIRYIHELAEVETDENGTARFTYGTTRDITDAKVLEESLIAANKAKSDFLAHMSHELRTPLNSILGFSDILKEELMGPIGKPQYKEYAAHILHSGQHLHAVLTDILDLSKIEAGAMEVHEEALDLNELVATCTAMSEGAALKKAVTLAVTAPADPVIVRGDKRLLRQAIFNILSNAIHYSPEEGKIDIAIRIRKGAGADIVIKDEGPGIPEGDMELVLQPFSQSNRNPDLAHQGTGLGLSLSSRIMELHDGGLALRSTPGKGMEVTLSLPEDRLARA
ncbi:hypothetical protein EOI86_04785 [Hwanghaeella grinnelliae]|uniref:histidine kinase n=1 Tax=Hwanghaeella grinnelliae TaxID=2500179 RepID=A0A437QVV1_9PROT|nr:PAS domain-containing sensor histidine kinase [Hwanghaeella grinnelliae]RVU38599.1 hypothetical protein EOI86_04785 [Hwanghaeella grinnelliae]